MADNTFVIVLGGFVLLALASFVLGALYMNVIEPGIRRALGNRLGVVIVRRQGRGTGYWHIDGKASPGTHALVLVIQLLVTVGLPLVVVGSVLLVLAQIVTPYLNAAP